MTNNGIFTDEKAEAERKLVEEVQADFAERQSERKRIERGWELDMNFLCGNQYCGLNTIQVGTHEANPTMAECTDCQSFKLK